MGKAERIRKTCIKIYNKVKKKRPNKAEKDYLKIVLLTKPPYAYQLDEIINIPLKNFTDIESLADFIADEACEGDMGFLWEARTRNLKRHPEVKQRNEIFFWEFWNT